MVHILKVQYYHNKEVRAKCSHHVCGQKTERDESLTHVLLIQSKILSHGRLVPKLRQDLPFSTEHFLK